MDRIHKKIIAGLMLAPFLFAITFCCCLDEQVSADKTHSNSSTDCHPEFHGSEKSDPQEHPRRDHECTCPKHLNFLSAPSADMVFDSSANRMPVRNFMTGIHLSRVALLAALSNHWHGHPWPDRSEHPSIPIYLKISVLRI